MKEELEALADELESVWHGEKPFDCDGFAARLRALAAKCDGEPVAFDWNHEIVRADQCPPNDIWRELGRPMFYAAPPAPVVGVPAEKVVHGPDDYTAIGWNACRAEMLRTAPASAPDRDAVKQPMKLLGYANPFRIKHTCADKPGGAHLGQVAIYAGEPVDPMEIQERENPTYMGEPLIDHRPACYACGCRSDNERDWMGRSICSKCQPALKSEPQG